MLRKPPDDGGVHLHQITPGVRVGRCEVHGGKDHTNSAAALHYIESAKVQRIRSAPFLLPPGRYKAAASSAFVLMS